MKKLSQNEDAVKKKLVEKLVNFLGKMFYNLLNPSRSVPLTHLKQFWGLVSV